jgi:large subunit ribosomal protein L19
MSTILKKIENENRRKEELPAFQVGDTVRVHVRIKEGDKERVQVFEGDVIGRTGTGALETFTVRRISFGEGVERIFPVHAPAVAKLEIKNSSQVRRAKLYYLRQRTGKAARLKQIART